MKKAIACIRSNDDVNGKLIAFFIDSETFELTNDSGENDGCFDFDPTCEEEVIYFIRQQWGTWSTFNWIEQE